MRWIVAATLLAVAAIAMGKGDAEHQFRHWGASDGLSGISVNCFLRSADGFMWIGTDKGLSRFDGIRFKAYDARAFEQCAVNSIQEDANGDLWIEYNAGYARYDHTKDALDCDVDGYLSNRMGIGVEGCRKIYADRDGNLWVVQAPYPHTFRPLKPASSDGGEGLGPPI